MEIGQENAEIVATLNLLSPGRTSVGVGSDVRGHAVVCVIDYSTANGAGINCVAEEISSLKNRPFVAYCSSAQNYVFLRIFVMGTKGKKYGSVCNAKPCVLRRKRRDTPSSNTARAATASYRCRWYRRSRSCSRQSGKTAR